MANNSLDVSKKKKSSSQIRSDRRGRQQRKRRTRNWFIYLGVGVIAFLLIASLFAGSLPFDFSGDSSPPVDQQGESIGIKQEGVKGGVEGLHFEPGEVLPTDYTSQPATSGYHYSGINLDIPEKQSPVAWRVYNTPISDEVLVHNLEHGGVGVHYNCPEGCPELIQSLVEIVGTRQKVLVSPYSDMENKIALTAWEYLDAFDVFDKKRIMLFIETHVNSRNAPEWNAPNMR